MLWVLLLYKMCHFPKELECFLIIKMFFFRWGRVGPLPTPVGSQGTMWSEVSVLGHIYKIMALKFPFLIRKMRWAGQRSVSTYV